jgi:hypothetical protein
MDEFKNFKSIKLVKNSKNPACKWKQSENQAKGLDVNNFTNGENIFNDYNVGVLTGKINNITIIDVDYYKFKDDNKFVKELGDKKYIKSLDTFTIRTPRGGYHLYFKYDEEIYTTTNAEIQIDIRNDNGYIVKYGSIIDNKMYKVWINKEIKKMPEDLKNWLIKNITPPKKNKITNLTEKTAHTLEKINYEQDFIDEVKKAIKKTKINLFEESYSFLKFTNGMKLLGLFDDWDAYNKTQDKYDYKKNLNCWNSCNTENYNFVNWICQKLEIDSYLLYKPLLKNVISPLSRFYKPKLDYDLYEQLNDEYEDEEIIIKNVKTHTYDDNCNPIYENKEVKIINTKSYVIKSDTGTGKTTSFKHYIKNNNLKFISIVSRISLGEAQYNTFSEENIKCKFYKYDSDFNNKDSIIIQLDSIRKLHSIDYKDYIIFLDEFNSIIEYLISSDTLQNIRVLIFQQLLKIIKSCKKVICVDADISDLCLYFLNFTKIDYVFLENTYRHNKGVEAIEVFDTDEFYQSLSQEDKFLCCCDSKKEAEVLHKKLEEDGIECLLITSETDEQIPDLDSVDKVIYSPRIVYGVDSVMKRPVYAYYTCKTINPKSMVQQIARCRNITYLKFLFTRKKYIHNDDTFEEHTEQFEDTNKYANLEFKALTDEKTYEKFFKLISYYEFNQKSYNTNKFSHFLNLIDTRGFVRDKTIKQKTVSKSNKVIKDSIKEDKYENFDLEDYSKVNAILRMTEEQAEENKDLFIDKYKLTKHFNLCNYINQNEEKIKESLLDKLDFNIVKIKSDKSKLVFLKRVKKIFGNEEIEINSKPVSKDESKKINIEYNHYFDKLTKTPDYTDKYECDKLQARIYKSLFPDSLVIAKKEKKRGETRDKTTYTIDKDTIEDNLSIYRIRNPNQNVNFLD